MMGCFGQRKKSNHREQVPIAVLAKLAEINRKGIYSAVDHGLALVVGNDKVGQYRENFEDAETLIYLGALLDASANPSTLVKHSAFGTTFKAHFASGTMVVKRLRDVRIPIESFHELIHSITSSKHQNILPIRAFYYGDEGKFLLYDYLPMGSLSDLLIRNKEEKCLLNWDERIGIALGVARAIAHIHSQGTTMFHGNIKTSNIVLTELLEARVSNLLDHIAKPFPGYNRGASYRAPKMASNCKSLQEADVYGFGVVLLELLTGKTSEEVDLPHWIVSVVENEWTSEVFELDILQHENVEEDLLRLLQVAVSCIAKNPANRPSMAQVRSQIEALCYTSS